MKRTDLLRLLSPTFAIILSGLPSLAADTTRTDISRSDLNRVRAVTAPTADFSKAEAFEAMSAGATTTRIAPGTASFSQPSATITLEQGQNFKLGHALFQKLWVSAPSSTQASDGLGPLYNARSCQTCHINDGRGRPPRNDEDAVSMIARLARPAQTPVEAKLIQDHQVSNFPDVTYGAQLQNLAVPGLKAEGKLTVAYEAHPVTLSDGEVVSLRQPSYSIDALANGPLETATSISPRIAQPTLGLGLIEAIAPEDIIANADPEDKNGDGISGKPALVRDHRTGQLALGRFGWKAQNATVRDQAAMAFSHDLGISTPDAPNASGDCTEKETDCLAMPTGVQKRLGDTEAPSPVLDLVTFYADVL